MLTSANCCLILGTEQIIALSCGIKISAVHHFDLSQSTHVTDGQTDRITTPKTALAYAHMVKIRELLITFHHSYLNKSVILENTLF